MDRPTGIDARSYRRRRHRARRRTCRATSGIVGTPRSSRFPLPRASRPPSANQAPPRDKRPSASPKAPPAGQRIRGRYELHEVAGRGGMAVVWRATQHGDVGFARLVAVKQMHEHLVESRVYVDMFAEEARVLSTLHSPNVASIYDFVHEKGQYYLVQEWIEGIDLGSWIHYWIDQDKRTRWDLVASIGIGMLRGLSAAHERRGPKEVAEAIVH
ncbi:MAG TPA: protein kinase, partial [Kofleriaceae bacterium]|nr:protein kinase [Kofleriaceae bacterium]